MGTIETCPHCNVRVVPQVDGTCPSCRHNTKRPIPVAEAPISEAPPISISQPRPWSWWLLLPIRLVVEIAVTMFDLTLSRYIIGGIIVGVIWCPLYLCFDLSYKSWLWPTVAIGLALTGLWEGCHMYEIRPYLEYWVLIPQENPRNKTQ